MSEESKRTPAARKKRVQTLKKLIILILILSIATPSVCCVLLFKKVHDLDKTLRSVMVCLEEMSQTQEELRANVKAEVSELDESVSEQKNSLNEGVSLNKEDIEENNASSDSAGTRKVYLTFDDGPSKYTDEILDILDQYQVKATFFVVGKEDEASKERLQEIVARGHSLGMHSYSHKYNEIYASLDNFTEDMQKLQDYLYDVTGVESRLYRFPGGSSNTVSKIDMHEFADVLERQNVTFYDWNISSGDGGRTLLSIEELVENCTRDIEKWDNAVILLHDSADKRTSVEALSAIIENILALEDTVILPITEDTEPVQHIHKVQKENKE